MKIAIVKGWAGVIAQKRAWGLEREVETLEHSIEARQLKLDQDRARLPVLRQQARDAAAQAQQPAQPGAQL